MRDQVCVCVGRAGSGGRDVSPLNRQKPSRRLELPSAGMCKAWQPSKHIIFKPCRRTHKPTDSQILGEKVSFSLFQWVFPRVIPNIPLDTAIQCILLVHPAVLMAMPCGCFQIPFGGEICKFSHASSHKGDAITVAKGLSYACALDNWNRRKMLWKIGRPQKKKPQKIPTALLIHR